MGETARVCESNRDNHASLRRRLRAVGPGCGATVCLDGRELVHMAGNNYLGLAGRPEVIDAACNGVRAYGAGAGASPLVAGHTELHEELAKTIADHKDTEAAAVFPSGFAANLGVIGTLVGEGDAVCADAENHASLIDACRGAAGRGARVRHYRHRDVERLRTLLGRAENAPRRYIVTDTVFSMSGRVAPLREIAQAASEFDAVLVVDDAHGTGVLGATGAGAVQAAGIDPAGVVQVGTLSKAIGAQGGFVAGDATVVDAVVNAARTMLYSTALAPACVGGAIEALRIVAAEPELRTNAREMRDKLRNGLETQQWNVLGDPEGPVLAVVIGSAARAVDAASVLRENGVFAPAIRPPTVKHGTSRIRLAPTAAHNGAHINTVLGAFEAVRAAMGGAA